VKAAWKILIVLLPGALLGAGAGALVTAFQFEHAVSVASVLPTAGIALMTGSIVLRIALSQNGLRLTDHGGLLANGACVLLSGLATIGMLTWVLQDGAAGLPQLLLALTLALISCLVLTALGVAGLAKLRKPETAGED
jgi:hypothetical protein